MKNQPLVSIILPSYNGERYIKEAIESVLNQSFGNFELILINDGSIDKTADILEEYKNKDSRIKTIHQENIGLAKSLNKGIRLAKGKYIARMDDDDLWLKEKLEKQIDFIEKNPEIGLLGTGCYEVTDKGKIIGKKIFPEKNQELQKDLIQYNPFIHSSIMAKREVFDEVGLYDEKFRESEDYELWLRIAENYKIANLAEPLVTKRYCKKSLSPAKDKEQLYFVLEAKKTAVRRGQYPKWCYFYFLKSWIFMKIPFFLRKFIRKYLLSKKFYKI